MHKTILATAIGLALAGSAVAVTIEEDTTTSWTEQSGSVAYDEDVTGTGTVDLTVSGAWTQAFGATKGTEMTVSGIEDLNVDIDKGVHAFYASNGSTLNVDVGSLTVTLDGRNDKQDKPIGIHAFGGSVNVTADGNITFTDTESNVIMAQQVGGHEGWVSIRAGGDVTITAKGKAGGVTVGSFQQQTGSAGVEIEGRNVTIDASEAKGDNSGVDAVVVYDYQKEYGTGHSKNLTVDIKAQQDLTLKGSRYGVYSTRKDGGTGAVSTFTAGNKISVYGNDGALISIAPDTGEDAENSISLFAPVAELTSNNAATATVNVGSKTEISFAGLNGGVTNVTVTNEAEQGNAISIAENATVSGTNAVLNVVKGDVAAENGTMTLTDSTVTLGEGVSMKLGTLNGTGTNTVALNSATSTATIKNATGHVVADFSDDALDSEGETATFTVETFGEGATLTARARNNGTDAVTQFENVASRVDAGESDYDLTLEAAGINDGLYATWDDDANASKGGVVNVRAGEENGVTHGLSQLAAVGYMQWRSAMNHMQYRLGEIRDQNGYNNGGWVRVYNGKDEFGSQNVENKYYGAQLGYDHKIAGTNVLVGGAFSYTRGESTFDLGEGDNYNYDFTLYGTWFADSGFFLDGTVKYGSLSNDVTFDRNNIAGAGTASYDTNAISVSAEAGWRFPVAGFAYVEPQAEVMYGHIWSADYSFNDIRVTNEAVDMTVGRLGVQAGLQCPNKKGGAYVRASVLHDFQGDADVTFRQGTNKVSLDEELGDTWYELGIGANWNVTDSTYVYADFNYTDGGEVESPWRWSLGVRMAW